MLNKLFILLFALVPAVALAQSGTIEGTVTGAEDGLPIPGANVRLVSTNLGAATTIEGEYRIASVPAGTYSLRASFVGFDASETTVTVPAGGTVRVDFALETINAALDGVEVLANRAIDRKTPVAFTDIPKEQIQQQLGARDLPMVLNTAPSVYATESGGGSGDARINVRGFDQRNTAVMINGVPVNDMENGWVYWSNWDGLGDAASSIQLQRGLAAVNLAAPSVGGTLNILTDPAQQEQGVDFKQEIGSGGFFKSTLQASTGSLDGRYAFAVNGVRKTGDGIIDGTWTDAWAYYAAASATLSPTNTLALYAVGAPQRHGQNLYRQNIAVYDTEFALGLDSYDSEALQSNGGTYNEAGREFNQNVASVSPSYDGLQAVGDNTFDRYDETILNERENFYHKPQINLNWYSQLSERMLLSTVGYYSGGIGGGTGTLGSSVVRTPFDGSGNAFYTSAPYSIDWDATIQRNVDNGGPSDTIIRNSRNNQNTLGLISKLTVDAAPGITAELGIDARTATIEHYREVRDLLGGDYFVDTSDEFNPTRQVGLGDKVDYYNENDVNWLGGYLQAEVERGPVTAFGMAGLTNTSYDYEDFFVMDDTGETLKLQSDNLVGYQFKGGALYNFTPAAGVFANLGYISKTPVFDGVINDVTGTLNPDPKNEDIFSFELGAQYRTRQLAVKLAAYRTDWSNRTINRGVDNPLTGEDAIVFLRGVEQLHSGLEAEIAYQPIQQVRIDIGAGIGDWSYTEDVTGSYELADRSASIDVFVPIDGLKVGDQPQTQVAYGVTLLPIDGLQVQALGRTYGRHFASFDPLGRALFDEDGDGEFDGDPDRAQSWQAPGYTIFDANFSYVLPLEGVPVGLEVFGNVFNLLDKVYIQDATDNSQYNGFDGDHDADDAEVYLGLPRRFNVGARLRF